MLNYSCLYCKSPINNYCYCTNCKILHDITSTHYFLINNSNAPYYVTLTGLINNIYYSVGQNLISNYSNFYIGKNFSFSIPLINLSPSSFHSYVQRIFSLKSFL